MISNAADKKLTENSGTIPDVSGALLQWYQPIVFTKIQKTVVGFEVLETPTDINFMGVVQPFSAKQLNMKPKGQRAWTWLMVHAEPGLVLIPDEVVVYQKVQYRVMSQNDYRQYGYVEYHMIQDYNGSGP